MPAQRDRKNQTALITGAASGIGLHIARELASLGYDIVAVDIRQDKILEISGTLSGEFGVVVNAVYMDLSSSGAPAALFDYCQKHELQIDILVNNAGIFFFKEMDRVDDKKFLDCIKLHVETPTMLCKLFGAEMKKRNRGYILIVSSLSAWLPYPGLTLYSATKRYLKTFAKALHYELASYNIGVTAVCPGAVNTSLYGLSERYTKIALKTGIMMRPEKLAKKAVDAMFRKKVLLLPGCINKTAVPMIGIIPVKFIQWLFKKTKILDKE